MALCDSFRRLAFDVWHKIRTGKTVNFQLYEETITDDILLYLKTTHQREVYVKRFTKRREGTIGADCELWFTGISGRWFGMRIQSKIIDIMSFQYKHLHFRSDNGIYQSDLLISSSQSDGIRKVPIYCLYSYWPDNVVRPVWPCRSYPFVIDSYGCSIMSAHSVKAFRNRNHISDVILYLYPWHCLVCCKGYSDSDLPERARTTLYELLRRSDPEIPEDDFSTYSEPPQYVGRMLTNELAEPPDEYLSTLVVMKEMAE